MWFDFQYQIMILELLRFFPFLDSIFRWMLIVLLSVRCTSLLGYYSERRKKCNDLQLSWNIIKLCGTKNNPIQSRTKKYFEDLQYKLSFIQLNLFFSIFYSKQSEVTDFCKIFQLVSKFYCFCLEKFLSI